MQRVIPSATLPSSTRIPRLNARTARPTAMAAETSGNAAKHGVRTKETDQEFGVQFPPVGAGGPLAARGELVLREVESQGIRRVAHVDFDPESWFAVAHAGNDLCRPDVPSIQQQDVPGTVKCGIQVTSRCCPAGGTVAVNPARRASHEMLPARCEGIGFGTVGENSLAIFMDANQSCVRRSLRQSPGRREGRSPRRALPACAGNRHTCNARVDRRSPHGRGLPARRCRIARLGSIPWMILRYLPSDLGSRD